MKMKYEFDAVYDRSSTSSLKYKSHTRYTDEKLIPLWVADMDFKTAPEIIDALGQTSEHGIFGYTLPDGDYFKSVINWNKKYFDFEIKEEWITPCEGVMSGIASAIRALTKPGDSVLIFQPVYHLFPRVINNNNRRLIVSELQFDGEKYMIHFEDLENKIIQNKVKAKSTHFQNIWRTENGIQKYNSREVCGT